MSDVFRKSVLNRLPAMPPTRAPWADGDDAEELDEEEELAGGDGLGSLGASLPRSRSSAQQDLSPISAAGYFSQALEVTPPGRQTTFRVYTTPPSPPPATGADPSNSGKKDSQGTYLICHHGAGASGLSFAPLAKAITEQSRGELGVLAFDARGHGKTRSEGPKSNDTDLALATLSEDFMGILQHIFPEPKEAPTLLLMGHSMGAAPILAASPLLQQKGYTIPGVIVLDVVEGTAVESLPLMDSILAQRPSSFQSVVDAIHWHISSNAIRNPTSARVSVPSFLKPSPNEADPGPQSRQIWRTDLPATKPYWMGAPPFRPTLMAEWWSGLSGKFLSAKCARMLVLAGQERLDRDLMVGQMQGKFQLEVMKDVGHYLHEDDPDGLAKTVIAFWRRNTSVLVLPPKIGSNAATSSVQVRQVGQD